MKKIFLIAISSIILGISCATTAEINLNAAVRASSDASFAFDSATRDFALAVSNYSSAIFNFEISVHNFNNAENETSIIRTRDTTFHAAREVRHRKTAVETFLEIAEQAYDKSMRTEVNFRRAQHDLLLSPDPWDTNIVTQNTATRAHNISVGVHNSALERLQTNTRIYIDLLNAESEIRRNHLAVLQKHDLASFPDEFMPVFQIIIGYVGEDNALDFLMENFDDFIDTFYENNNLNFYKKK